MAATNCCDAVVPTPPNPGPSPIEPLCVALAPRPIAIESSPTAILNPMPKP